MNTWWASKDVLSVCIVVLLAFGCTGAPSGVVPVSGFELDRYLGTWFELARLDHPFERGLTDVTAEYSIRDAGGVQVVNRGFDSKEGRFRTATGKAFFLDDASRGALKVSFFGPFYGGYHVIALDQEGYAWSMVSGPNRSYLWILGRSPELDPAILEKLIARADALGFPVSDLIRVSHERAEAAPTP